MNLTWSNRVIKYILFVFNLIFVITGIIMIAVGVSVKSYYTDYDIFLNGSYFSLPNLLIAIGSMIFFISFFGCCGAVKENWFMIFIFSILLTVIFIMEFSAGIAGYVLRDKTTSYLTDELRESMKHYKYNSDKPDANTIAWDEMQETFHCCGANGPKDWIDIITPTTADGSTTATVTTGAPTTTTTTATPATNDTPPPTTKTTTTTTITTPPPSQKGEPAAQSLKSVLRNIVFASSNKNDLPGSCCKSRPGATGTIICNLDSNSTTYYKIGCVEGFGNYLKDHAVTIGGVGLAIGFIQLLGVIFACHLTKQLKHGFYST